MRWYVRRAAGLLAAAFGVALLAGCQSARPADGDGTEVVESSLRSGAAGQAPDLGLKGLPWFSKPAGAPQVLWLVRDFAVGADTVAPGLPPAQVTDDAMALGEELVKALSRAGAVAVSRPVAGPPPVTANSAGPVLECAGQVLEYHATAADATRTNVRVVLQYAVHRLRGEDRLLVQKERLVWHREFAGGLTPAVRASVAAELAKAVLARLNAGEAATIGGARG